MKRITILSVVILCITACGVTRENPFDPDASNYIGRAPQKVSATDGEYPEWVLITWSPCKGASKYAVLREEEGKQVLIGASEICSFYDVDIIDNQEYTYRIAAVFPDGNNGEYSDSDTGYAHIPIVQNLSASDGSEPSSIELQWDMCEGAHGYYIYRKDETGEYELLDTSTTPYYTDTTVDDLAVYHYKIAAYYTNEAAGIPSEEDSGYALKLDAPSYLTASRGKEDGEITLHYEGIAGSDGYYIYRSETENGNYEKTGTTTQTTYNDTVDNGKKYYYKIKSVSHTCNRVSEYSISSWGLALEHHTILDTGIILLRIPKGNYVMGEDGVAEPRHTVTVSRDFYIGESEITWEQWNYVINKYASSYDYFFESGQCGDLDFGDTQQPVVNITWHDAVKFCNLLSELNAKEYTYVNGSSLIYKENKPYTNEVKLRNNYDSTIYGYRLPFEYEWEYACRAWTTTSYYWGNDYSTSDIKPYAWMEYTSNDHTSPVMQFLPNNFALYDMSGNVWEMCWDENALYSTGAQTNPIENNGEYEYRIKRGGSYSSTAGSVSSGKRSTVNITVTDGSGINTGFRVALYAE